MKQEIKRRIAQLNNGEIPDGYKKNDFGVFPCDWVTDKKLKDIGSFGKGKGIPGDKMQSEGVPCVGYGDIYMKYNHFHFEKPMSFVDEETAYDSQLIKKGTLLFTGTGETADEIGKCVCYNGEDDIYAGGDIITYITDQVNPLFITYQQYQPFSLRKKASFGQGHSVVHIQKESLEKLDVAYPPSSQEQSRIAEILMIWDEAIELYQQQIEKLNKLKRSALANLFPQKGKRTPKYRFAGFTDPWEQRKLGELCSEFKSGEYIKSEEIKNTGSYPVFGGNGVRGYTDHFNHDGEFALIGRQGALCGNVNYSSGKAYFTEHAVAVKANESNSTRFLFYCLGKMNLGQYSGQSAQPGLAVGNLVELKTMVPAKPEQEHISAILSTLDYLITLHLRKCETIQHQRMVLQQYLLNGIVRVKI